MIIYKISESTNGKALGTIIISDYSKTVGYKINIQKFIASRQLWNEQEEFETKTITPFTLASSKMKMHVNLTKCV